MSVKDDEDEIQMVEKDDEPSTPEQRVSKILNDRYDDKFKRILQAANYDAKVLFALVINDI